MPRLDRQWMPIGGLAVYVTNVAREFARRRWTVDLYIAAAADLPQARWVRGVRIIAVPSMWTVGGQREPDLERCVASLRSAGITPPTSYDVVHSHYWRSVRLGAALAQWIGSPYVHTFHTLGVIRDRRAAAGERAQPRARHRIEQWVAVHADALVVSSELERGQVRAQYGDACAPVTVVAPGAVTDVVSGVRRPARWRGSRRRLELVVAGRLSPAKGVDIAIQAAPITGELLGRDVRLLIIGSVDASATFEAGRLKHLVRRLADQRCQIELLGHRPQAEVYRHYAICDVALMCSHTETFGIAALEALAQGTPVVGPIVGGLPQLVDRGRTGLLVGDYRPESFAQAIAEVASEIDPALSRKAAREATRNFTWVETSRCLEALYRGVGVARRQTIDSAGMVGAQPFRWRAEPRTVARPVPSALYPSRESRRVATRAQPSSNQPAG